MNRRFASETIEEGISLWVSGAVGEVRTALEKNLAAAGFRVVPPGEGDDPYVHLLVDMGQSIEELRRNAQVVAPRVKRVLLSFDSSRKKELLQVAPDIVEFQYVHVFLPGTPPVSHLDELLRRVVWDDALKIVGGECQPLWYEDICEHLAQLFLGGKFADGCYMSDQHIPLTQLMAALRQKLGVREGKKEKTLPTFAVLGKSISGRNVSALIEDIGTYYESIRPSLDTTNTHGLSTPRKQGGGANISQGVGAQRRPNTKRRFHLFLLGASLTVGIVVATSYFLYTWSVRAIGNSLQKIVYDKGDQENIAPLLGRARSGVSVASFFVSLTDPLSSGFQQGKAGEMHEALPLAAAGVDGYSEMAQAKRELIASYKMLMSGQKGDTFASLRDADVHLDTAYRDFSLLQARFVQGDVLFPESLGGKEIQAELVAHLPEMRRNITTLRSLIGILPRVIGGDRPHSYAMALLDSSNPRGSGGSVAAVAILTIDKGKLLTLQVYSLSTLNQMLVGKVNAPDEIRTFLRSPSWNLADATWEVSFRKVAQQLLWFLGKQLDRPLDGAFAIPSSTLPTFLVATGPLKIPKTGEVISQDSFQTSLENAIAGLSQNPSSIDDYYANVLSALMAQFQKGEEGALTKLLGAMVEKLTDADVAVSVADAASQRVFGAFSWDNVPLAPACPPEFAASVCSVDTAYETENSLGENNVGVFVKRSHTHTIRVGSEVLLHNRILTLTNTTSLLAWPYGTYQTLVKLLINETAQIQSVSINDVPLSPDKFSLLKEDGKLVIRLPVEVAPTATTRVRFVYTTPGIPKEGSSLVFFEQKQAGMDNDPFMLVITYPDKYTPKSVAPRADVGRTSLTFTSKHDANRLFGVGF